MNVAIDWFIKTHNDEYLSHGKFACVGDHVGRRSIGRKEVIAIIFVKKNDPRPYHYAHRVSGWWEVFGEYKTLAETKARAQVDEPVLL